MIPSPISSLAARGLLALGLAVPVHLPAAPTDTPTLDAQEQAFVAKATADNSMQIALAKVALSRSSSTEVKALARRIIDDHAELNRKFTRFAVATKAHGDAHGVSNQAVIEDRLRLQSQQGSALDEMFARMMVKEHRKVIPLYEQAARHDSNKELRQIARDGLPLLREHLRRAQALTGR